MYGHTRVSVWEYVHASSGVHRRRKRELGPPALHQEQSEILTPEPALQSSKTFPFHGLVPHFSPHPPPLYLYAFLFTVSPKYKHKRAVIDFIEEIQMLDKNHSGMS